MTTPEPGSDPAALTDEQLRAAITEYGIDSPWKGDNADYELRQELHARHPLLAGLWRAIDIACEADIRAAEATDPHARITLNVAQSPTTAALREAYGAHVHAWLAAATQPQPPADATAAEQLLLRRGAVLKRARQRERAATAAAQGAARLVLDHKLLSEAHAARALGVDRMTLRKWNSK